MGYCPSCKVPGPNVAVRDGAAAADVWTSRGSLRRRRCSFGASAGSRVYNVVCTSHQPPATRRRPESQLHAAEALVAKGGFTAASVRAVAARAGIGASTMRYWFPSQEALSTAIAQSALTLELRDERITDQPLPPAERLAEFLMQFLPVDEDTGALLRDGSLS
ncbi:TetR family transcriptional regulator [Arthrobacter sp. NPDC055585]